MRTISSLRGPVAGIVAAVAGAVLLLGAGWSPTGWAASPRQDVSASDPIQHIVVIVRENHSFDNLFGRFPNADGATTAHEGSKVVKLGVTPDRLHQDLGHGSITGDLGNRCREDGPFLSHQQRHSVSDEDLQAVQTVQGVQGVPGCRRVPVHAGADPELLDVRRRTSRLADHFFSTVMGDSFPNHLVTIAGQNFNVIDNPTALRKARDIVGLRCRSRRHSARLQRREEQSPPTLASTARRWPTRRTRSTSAGSTTRRRRGLRVHLVDV